MILWLPPLCLGACRPAPAQLEPRPGVAGRNVLLVLLDDVGVDRIASYGVHPRPARTPTLDRLADRGVRFSRAYAFPTCSTTRSALLTSRYGRRTGVSHNVKSDASRGLPHREVTIAEVLGAGAVPYTSAGVGKWHLEPREVQSVADPLAQGFTSFSGPLGNLEADESFHDYTWHVGDGSVQTHTTTYLTTREIDEALALLQRLPEPWFLYLSLHAPHSPWDPPPDALLAEPLPVSARGLSDRYDAVLEAADTELARLMDQIDPSDTLVMVLGDNGTPGKVTRPPTNPRRAKGTVHEGGIRVPWIVLGAGVPGGRVIDERISVVDVLPTLAEMSGIDLDTLPAPIDGHSLWPLLLDEPHEPRPPVFIEKYFVNGPGASRQALIEDRYKLIRTGTGDESLFDLQARRTDGPDLLEAPLSPEAQEAYARLSFQLDALDRELQGGWLDSPGCR
ncbi:MAG TPA: hypothetical protein ENK18_18205 [Deltaproteobacteria bacterium]|nr:hypothetical protein [Deltaproteobacteria bacterium]